MIAMIVIFQDILETIVSLHTVSILETRKG